MELGDHTGQPIAAQHLGGDHVDAAVVAGGASDFHRIQDRVVGARIGQPSQPILLFAEGRKDLFDAHAVVGGHVERTRHSRSGYRQDS